MTPRLVRPAGGSALTRRAFLTGTAGATLGLTASGFAASRPAVLEQRPNVLVLVFDALSAHHMSLYGYRRATTPHLQRLAERATVYHAHFSGGNFTTPGTASLLTGTYPWSHRAFHLHGTVADPYVERSLFAAVPAGYTTLGFSHNLLVVSLFQQFRRQLTHVKRTRDLCLVDNQHADRLFPTDYNVAFWAEWQLLRGGEYPPSGLLLSFVDRLHRYVDKREIQGRLRADFPRGVPNLHSLFFVLEDAVDWLMDELSRLPAPWLCYCHVLPPHEPYLTRRDFVDAFADGWRPEPKPESRFSEGKSPRELDRQRREYDEYLAYADGEFGRLHRGLTARGLLDHTVLVVTADHGELFERGIRGHVTPALYDPVTRIPLLIARPGQSERRDVREATSCVDVVPTVAALTGAAEPDWAEGRVLPGLDLPARSGERQVYVVEAKSNPKNAPLEDASVALIRWPYKLVAYLWRGSAARYELYDLAADPEERSDLYASRAALAAELRTALSAKLADVNGAQSAGNARS